MYVDLCSHVELIIYVSYLIFDSKLELVEKVITYPSKCLKIKDMNNLLYRKLYLK